MPTKSERREYHEKQKFLRSKRIESGIYGKVCQPIIEKNSIGIWDPPSFTKSSEAARLLWRQRRYGINYNLDVRCFYTGVNLIIHDGITPFEMVKNPWYHSKDHLVPIRQHYNGVKLDLSGYKNNFVLSSSIANVSFRVAPLLVKLKVRQWLMTTVYERDNPTTESGTNMRWLIFHYLEWFRINGRFPWSMRSNGVYWDNEIQIPFMNHMLKAEKEFLNLSIDEKDHFIRNLEWRF